MPSLVGKEIGHTGYGMMRLTWNPTPPTKEQSFAALDTALSQGATFWNAGELYGSPTRHSLHLLREYFESQSRSGSDENVAEKIVLSVKGGIKPGTLTPDGSETNLRRSVEDCLAVLAGTKQIDIFEPARLDPNFTVEEQMGVLRALVREGKIGGIGLSEVDAETIRRAHKIHPIAAVEVEFSLFATDILHNGIAATCTELGIPIVAYSPLGRGVLAGAFTRVSDIPDGDFRKILPKYQDGAIEQNLKRVNELNKFAARKGVAPVQLALGWLRSLSGRPGLPTIIPIPGGTTPEKIVQNTEGVPILSDEEMEEIDEILKRNEIVGSRY
ncbi:hypothetical protein MAP00_000383 [Monascus purpureus]|nr:hypothetical protein MAP00_000383 [Monascus purpureus]